MKGYGVALDKKPSKGISVLGNERDVRNAFISIIHKAVQSSTYSIMYFERLFDEKLRSKVREFTSAYESLSAIQFSDDSSWELRLNMCYQYLRIQQKKNAVFPFVEKKELIQKSGFQRLQALYTDIFSRQIPDDEVVYLLKQLKGAKISVLPEDLNMIKKQDEAYQITWMFANEVEHRLGIDFKQDIEFMNGLIVHLQVALHRLENKQIIENPLTEQVKYKYRYIFEITRKAIQKIETIYHLVFPEEEIAYIAMHLGASYERHSFSGYMPTALVVCGSGIATSSLLTTRLKLMVPELKICGTVRTEHITHDEDESIDFIISTVPLSLEKPEVIVVNPLLEPDELMNLKRMIFKKSYQKQMDELIRKELPTEEINILGEFISGSHIQIKGTTEDWREAINMASRPLIKEHIITKSYVKAMIHAVEELGPYMVFMPEVAFVHAAGTKDNVFKEGASLLVLDQAIPFGDEHKVMVSIIIVICSKESDSNIFINLVKILERQGNLDRIKHSESIEEITSLK
ncbi:PRD domain-containing protein [Virgibacillus halophilus]|uniref:PRD domain-containing protein n=1 Tax=Tigheibacillus halophilus TaxID=361280 RepID=A0ABU5C997_9BACI|nr:PRD domain-containing protein [Virgibacillus halophilus]